MKVFTGLKAFALVSALGVFATPQTLGASETLSMSNAPMGVLTDELSVLFAQERDAMKGASAEAVAVVLANYRPKAKPTPPVKVEYTKPYLAQLPQASGGEAWECLSEALYFEARGESVKGQFAVAEVILNRVSSPAFPDTVCGVVNQGTGKKYQCQFTYTCDGQAEAIHEPKAYTRVGKVARLMLDGAPRRLTEGATHYHTTAVNPRWARKFPRTAQIGVHFFYKMPRA
ncbi:cell wall hydrolase [Celeribacter sp.]|uniref:cell wall hydrolase n=1 Tax=Celeribacter sp. TaxID=1890673 RepID=UPI003A8D4DFE